MEGVWDKLSILSSFRLSSKVLELRLQRNQWETNRLALLGFEGGPGLGCSVVSGDRQSDRGACTPAADRNWKARLGNYRAISSSNSILQ